MNKCIFIGRTTRDIELRYTQSANPLAVGNTSLAVESGYGEKKKTYFFNITAFGKTAETMGQFVKKGTKIAVECEAKEDEYTNREGNKVRQVSFLVKSFEFMEKKSANGNTQQQGKNEMPQDNGNGFYPVNESISDDDLPF